MAFLMSVKSYAKSALNRLRRPARLRDSYSHKRPTTLIGTLLDRQGSDKGLWYETLYDCLFDAKRADVLCLVEIGIGSLLPPSGMIEWAGENYRPGGSLRAWRDYFPNAQIHGIDPAPDTRIDGETRITTHQFDSRDAAAAQRFLASLEVPPDILVEDGLHEPEAQLVTLKNFLPYLPGNAFYILEDVRTPNAKPILSQIDQIRPGCLYLPDSRPEPWVAIVIRTPT
jgi:hypothetical protein